MGMVRNIWLKCWSWGRYKVFSTTRQGTQTPCWKLLEMAISFIALTTQQILASVARVKYSVCYHMLVGIPAPDPPNNIFIFSVQLRSFLSSSGLMSSSMSSIDLGSTVPHIIHSFGWPSSTILCMTICSVRSFCLIPLSSPLLYACLLRIRTTICLT